MDIDKVVDRVSSMTDGNILIGLALVAVIVALGVIGMMVFKNGDSK